MLYRVMKPIRAFGRVFSYVRAGRTFRSKEAALRLAAGIACAYVIDDRNMCVAAHLRNGKIVKAASLGESA